MFKNDIKDIAIENTQIKNKLNLDIKFLKRIYSKHAFY